MIRNNEIIVGQGREFDVFAGGGGYGDWQRSWGQEIVHRYLLPLVHPGDRVLDLASGMGRSSLPLVLYGASVVLVDQDGQSLDVAKEIFKSAGLDNQLEAALELDMRTLSSQKLGRFDFIVACDAIVHMGKQDGFFFIDSLPKFLNQGCSFIYLTAPSTQSWSYSSFRNRVDLRPDIKAEKDTFLDLCNCSGTEKVEKIPFYFPGEIEARLEKAGGRVVFSGDSIISQFRTFGREIIAKFNF